MASVVPSLPSGGSVITCEYNPVAVDDVGPGLAWVILHDNVPLGWNVDAAPVPVILGTMPAAPPVTDPVISPPWAQCVEGTVLVPDIWRGPVAAFFTHLATNNGARRALYANFADSALAASWQQWSETNPTLALSSPPNVEATRAQFSRATPPEPVMHMPSREQRHGEHGQQGHERERGGRDKSS